MTPPHTAPPRIVLTGATGAVGQHVAHRLAPHLPVKLLVRDPEKATRLHLPGHINLGNYQNRQQLQHLMADADLVFLVTANPLRPEEEENLLAAATTGRAQRIVKLSGLSVADPQAHDLITQWNRHSEELLRASGLPWTILRTRALMSNTLSWAKSVREEGVVRALNGDAPSAYVDPRDVAEAAVKALTNPAHAGKTYSLTGATALSPRQQCATLAHHLGHPLKYENLTTEEALHRWRDRYPEPLATALLEAALHTHSKAHIEDDLTHLLTRHPTSYHQWAQDHIDRFQNEPAPPRHTTYRKPTTPPTLPKNDSHRQELPVEEEAADQ